MLACNYQMFVIETFKDKRMNCGEATDGYVSKRLSLYTTKFDVGNPFRIPERFKTMSRNKLQMMKRGVLGVAMASKCTRRRPLGSKARTCDLDTKAGLQRAWVPNNLTPRGCIQLLCCGGTYFVFTDPHKSWKDLRDTPIGKQVRGFRQEADFLAQSCANAGAETSCRRCI
jgi:hypothetical protein